MEPTKPDMLREATSALPNQQRFLRETEARNEHDLEAFLRWGLGLMVDLVDYQPASSFGRRLSGPDARTTSALSRVHDRFGFHHLPVQRPPSRAVACAG
jgi:hypothetical protein